MNEYDYRKSFVVRQIQQRKTTNSYEP